ncbi:hypothetical protein [Spirosoma montaniterrae]|uniref:Addiction module protein n=1 Tax=Spirosoma montaniterrae TaxID=1178516 RepID=A0A1P9X3F6_9BACT|nr:hypothetical protein [Spirosoma montaniterrae]AQG82137.1 hypothetical protein AWR27_24275 [Spirosoma montaniterrae]
MAATIQLSYRQVADLARQLPASEKRKLARQLVKEVEQEDRSVEDTLTPAQRKTWNTIKQGFAELKQYKEGKLKTRSLKEVLNEL